MGALIPIITALLPSLIKVVEGVFAGEKQGGAKKDAVLSVSNSLLDVLVNAGKIKQGDREAIAKLLEPLLEGVLSGLKDSGALPTAGVEVDSITVNTAHIRLIT